MFSSLLNFEKLELKSTQQRNTIKNFSQFLVLIPMVHIIMGIIFYSKTNKSNAEHTYKQIPADLV